LTEQYKDTTKKYKELQRKFRHFEKADNARFNDIWAMNEAEVRELANKVL
jgi:dynein regulatory complex protein 1